MLRNKQSETVYSVVMLTVVVLGIYFTGNYAYVLFHGLVEVVSIAIAFAMCVLVWNTRTYLANNYLWLLGIGYASSAFIDLLHTFAFKGVTVFSGYGDNLAPQLWLSARYLQTATLLVAPLVIQRPLNNRLVLAGYVAAITALLVAVYSRHFPDCIVTGKGLTPFKKNSEYVISAILLVSLYLLSRKRSHFSNKIYWLIFASVGCTIVSELMFTTFVSMYDFTNKLGHIAKLVAFYLMYRAILTTGLREPFEVVFRTLKQTEQELRVHQETLEDRIRERTASLENTNKTLELEVRERQRAEERLRRLNRELQAISNCNQVLVRAVDEQTLLNDICRIICDEAGYRLAWVGFAEHDDAKTVRPVAWGGFDDGYVANARLSWADDAKRAKGPGGTAIRRGETVIVQDFTADPRTTLWWESALQRGYRSMIGLPLKDEGAKVFGVLLIYSTEIDAFTPDEVRLLEELAGDLAFGLTVLRGRIERQRAEDLLWKQGRLNEALFSQAISCFVIYDRNWKFIRVNEAYAKHYKKRPEDVEGRYYGEVFPNDDQSQLPTITRELLESKNPVVLTGSLYVFADQPERGDTYWDIIFQPLFDQKGEVEYIFFSSIEVTERKRAEGKVKQLAAIVESSDDAIIGKALDETILSWNRGAERIYGYTATEIVGCPVSILVPPGLEAELAVIMDGVKRGEGVEHLETTRVRKDGRTIQVALTISPIKDARGQIVGASTIARDVTERKQAEEALRQSEARLSFALETNNIGAWDLNLRDHAAHRTLIHDRIFGYTTLVPEWTYEMFLEHVLPADRPEVARKFGEAIKTRSGWNFECRIRRTDGEVRWIWATGSHELNTDGQPTLMSGLVHDITERKRAEQELHQLNQELEQRVQQRTAQLEAVNKELESFSYSVSHDLRAPLRSINGFSRALLEDYFDKFDAEGKENLQTIRAASQRMDHLIDDMLRLAQINRGEMHHQEVDLSQVATRVAEDLKKAEPERNVEFIVAPDCVVSGDASLLRIAMENILGNAWKYTSKKPSARIEFGTAETAAGPAFFVRDNGCGFDMKYVNKLFGAFQRLHAVQDFPGTGIGLASVQRVMRRHRGKAWIEGQVDHGTTLYFTLPIAGTLLNTREK